MTEIIIFQYDWYFTDTSSYIFDRNDCNHLNLKCCTFPLSLHWLEMRLFGALYSSVLDLRDDMQCMNNHCHNTGQVLAKTRHWQCIYLANITRVILLSRGRFAKTKTKHVKSRPKYTPPPPPDGLLSPRFIYFLLSRMSTSNNQHTSMHQLTAVELIRPFYYQDNDWENSELRNECSSIDWWTFLCDPQFVASCFSTLFWTKTRYILKRIAVFIKCWVKQPHVFMH